MPESSSEEKDEGGTDRMSSLPDSLLCYILSFLPTKTCVTTSLVSRRWRHLWKDLLVLDFYDDYHKLADQQFERFLYFAFFVDAVLAHRRARGIQKLRLSCGNSQVDLFYASSIKTWIRTAIGPQLEELHLALFSSDGDCFLLSLSLFTTCTNLVSLSLCGEIYVDVEQEVRLPSLKMLQLDIGRVDVDSVDALLSGCPILETLHLSFSPDLLTRVRVPPSLKRLTFTVENNVGASLEMDVPGLKYLSITNIKLDAVGNLHNVERAYIDVISTGESVDHLLNLLRALSGTKHLVLCRSTTKCFFRAPVIDFSEFRYLLHLELILPNFNSRLLFNVLQKCHMLQDLIIQNDQDRLVPSIGCAPAAKPKSVPNCLVSHLTFIHFKGYQGLQFEMEFAGYVLQNGLVMKTMLIAGLSLHLKEKWEKYRILKKNLDIPRGSAICQLKFD